MKLKNKTVNNIKKILCGVLSATALMCTFSVSASAAVDGICSMTGKLYYFDTPTGRIVLKDVKPVTVSDMNADKNKNNIKTKEEEKNTEAEEKKSIDFNEAAKTAEYVEIPTAEGGRFFLDGNAAASEWINNYADREIWFIAAVSDGKVISVPYFKIIV